MKIGKIAKIAEIDLIFKPNTWILDSAQDDKSKCDDNWERKGRDLSG